MISEKLRAAVGPMPLILYVLWAAQFATFGVYYVIPSAVTFTSSSPGQLPYILLVVAGGVALLAAVALKTFLFSQGRAQGFLARIKPGAGATADGLTHQELAVVNLSQRTMAMYVICLGLINACGILGMILAMDRRDDSVFIPFGLCMVIVHVFCMPRLLAFVDESITTLQHGLSPRE